MMTRITSAVMALTMTFAAQAEDWIGWVENEAYVSQLSIPGTHDSATGEGFTGLGAIVGKSMALTQEKTIAQQWDCGVRAFDLRPAVNGSSLEIYHGVCQTKLSLAGALDVICDKLDEHPTEFAIILTRHETDGDSSNSGWADAMASLLKTEKYASHMVAYSPSLTVQQMRGKFVMLSRDNFTSDKVGFVSGWSHSSDFASQQNVTAQCGSQSGRLAVQDFYECTASGADQTKINAVTTMNNYAARLCDDKNLKLKWVINHTSGYTKSASSDGNRDMAAKANTALMTALTASDRKAASTGIVMMDFAGVDETSGYQTNGQALIDAVIEQNFHYGMFKEMPLSAVLVPTPTSPTTRYFHSFTAVRRGNLAVTQTSNSTLCGTTVASNKVPTSAQWEIEERADGTFDIKNRESGQYISPESQHNTIIYVSDSPASIGWVFTPVGTTGLYTITCSNSVQLHQTMPSMESAIYNWYGTETLPDQNDFGGLFRVSRVSTAANTVRATAITLDVTEKEVVKGTGFDLKATLSPANVTNPALTWASSDPEVATVDDNGHVQTLQIGQCDITVSTTDGSELSARCTVKVLPILAEWLKLDVTEKEAVEGSEFDLTATIGPDGVSNPALTWSSSDPAVATVDGDGHVKVLKAGECDITVSTTDGSGLTATCRLLATSGIAAVKAADIAGAEIFDLTGRRLRTVKASGLYIVNGRKTFVSL